MATKNSIQEKPARYYVARPFRWNRRSAETDLLENQNTPPYTVVEMKPSDASMLVAAKKLEEFDEKNPKHAEALKAESKPTAPVLPAATQWVKT